MRSFQHNIDNTIIIVVDGKRYQDTLENFKKDYPANYALPVGYVGRMFLEGQDHYLIKEKAVRGWQPDNNERQETSWPEGVAIFEALDAILQARGIRVQTAAQNQAYEEQLKNDLAVNRLVARESRDSGASRVPKDPRKSPLSKYHNIARTLQETGLLDRLLRSSDKAALSKLGLNGSFLFDDSQIKISLRDAVLGITPQFSVKEIELFDVLLLKADFDFSLTELLVGTTLEHERGHDDNLSIDSSSTTASSHPSSSNTVSNNAFTSGSSVVIDD